MVSPSQYANQPAQDTGAIDIGERLDELRAELARLTTQAQDYLQTRGSDLRDSAAEATDNIEEIIRENPLPAVGLALGVGFILGLLARGGRFESRDVPRLTRRDVDRLASRLTETLTTAGSRAREAAEDVGDNVFLERLAGALTGLLESSKQTMASVGSAGARSVAAMGEKTARSIADRLSAASR